MSNLHISEVILNNEWQLLFSLVLFYLMIMSAISRILWHKNGFWVVKEKITSQYNSFDASKLRVITKNNESINAWARWKRKKKYYSRWQWSFLNSVFASIYGKELLILSNFYDGFCLWRATFSFFTWSSKFALFDEIRTDQYSPMRLSQAVDSGYAVQSWRERANQLVFDGLLKRNARSPAFKPTECQNTFSKISSVIQGQVSALLGTPC